MPTWPHLSGVLRLPRRAEVGFITDVEGNMGYLLKAARASRVLDVRGDSLRMKSPQHYLVFGGDVSDHGGSDLSVAEALVELRDSAPDNVFFLLGNRDVNKMRFTSELHSTDLQRAAEEIVGAHWQPRERRVEWSSYLRVALPDPSAAAAFVPRSQRKSVRAERLKWMLRHTMGSPHAFESRRAELLARAESGVDEDVAESFLASVRDEGSALRRYLFARPPPARLPARPPAHLPAHPPAHPPPTHPKTTLVRCM
jgi:hypothetical protein